VEKAARLAEYLLRDDPQWTSEKIYKAMHSGKETTVKLQKKIPVFIAYFTAWVDSRGHINFREDIYGHDEKMMNLLF
jgi:murein L,D-transpeptidase YcbB/YkuD